MTHRYATDAIAFVRGASGEAIRDQAMAGCMDARTDVQCDVNRGINNQVCVHHACRLLFEGRASPFPNRRLPVAHPPRVLHLASRYDVIMYWRFPTGSRRCAVGRDGAAMCDSDSC